MSEKPAFKMNADELREARDEWLEIACTRTGSNGQLLALRKAATYEDDLVWLANHPSD